MKTRTAVDMGLPAATPVEAPASGSVTFAGSVPSAGKTVSILSADGYSVTLVHLGAYSVRRGVPVSEGEVVGAVGPSGEPELAQPYVHLGVRLASDPQGYVIRWTTCREPSPRRCRLRIPTPFRRHRRIPLRPAIRSARCGPAAARGRSGRAAAGAGEGGGHPGSEGSAA